MMYKGATAGPVVKLFSEAELIKSCVPAFITKNFLVRAQLFTIQATRSFHTQSRVGGED